MLQPTIVKKKGQSDEEAKQNYEAEVARRNKEIKEGGGVTSFGTTHAAVDIMKSPLVTGEGAGNANPPAAAAASAPDPKATGGNK